MASYGWPGYLLLQRGSTLRAQALDARQPALVGEPSVVAEGVDLGGFSASRTGSLAFVSSRTRTTEPTWFDRDGQRLRTIGEPGVYEQITLSPDGRRAAVQRRDPRLDTTDIWILDLTRGVLSRFTFDPGSEFDPVWSPDGRRLAFSAEGQGKGRQTIFLRELGGSSAERLLPDPRRAFPEDWSRDGRFILYGSGVGGDGGLWAVPLSGDRKSFPLVDGPYGSDEPQLSPDGHLLAYGSTESGQWEVYVQEFPGPGPKTRLSAEGGAQPRWRGDGRELFYLALDGTLMSVPFRPGTRSEPDVPRKLFSMPLTVTTTPGWDQYGVTADGQRFLVLAPVGDAAPFSITVVLNWAAGLDRDVLQ
jgi:dipeptidyl aminopeptidase/acylaminoacyl peptidase